MIALLVASGASALWIGRAYRITTWRAVVTNLALVQVVVAVAPFAIRAAGSRWAVVFGVGLPSLTYTFLATIWLLLKLMDLLGQGPQGGIPARSSS